MVNNERIWKPILGFEGLYEINNIGEIKSLDRVHKNVSYNARLTRSKFLKPNINNSGYLNVRLKDSDENVKTYLVHRLVALSFIRNTENKEYVNHIDGNKLNNNINNLEWSTPSENNFHSIKSNLNKCTRSVIMVNSLSKEIIKIFPSLHEADRQTGIDYRKIYRACTKNVLIGDFYFDYIENAYKYKKIEGDI